jgi:hypothetical protein
MALTVVSSGIEDLHKSESCKGCGTSGGSSGDPMQVVLTFNSVLFTNQKFHFTMDFFAKREGQ